MARTKQTLRKAGKGLAIRRSMSPGSKRRQRRSQLNAQRAELRTQVALFPSICVGEEQMRLAVTLGVAGSEATLDAPVRVATRVFPPSAAREANRIPIIGVFMRMGLVPHSRTSSSRSRSRSG